MSPFNRHRTLILIENYGIAAVIVLAPFTAFISTWLGATFGHLDLFRIWKEILTFSLAILAICFVLKDTRLRRWLMCSWLTRLIFIYTLLHLTLGLLALSRGDVNATALIYALLINLRFFVFLTLVIIITSRSGFLMKNWSKFVLIPAFMVIVFAVLQRFILPYDFLKHFGYGPKTIPTYQTVDEKMSYRRIQSTLRGANPLGAYLLFVLPLLWLKLKVKTVRYFTLLLGLIAMFYSYSRGAILGLFITVCLLIVSTKIGQTRKRFIYLLMVVTIVALFGTVALRNNNSVQNTFFHTDETSKSSISSNTGHLNAIEHGSQDIINEPLGRGPGTAGPASTRNKHSPRIAESYFIQIGQEVGVAGVCIFIVINILVAQMLWRQRKNQLAIVLLAILVGLTFVNLISHAWADDTLAYVFWGLTAIAISPDIMNKERK